MSPLEPLNPKHKPEAQTKPSFCRVEDTGVLLPEPRETADVRVKAPLGAHDMLIPCLKNPNFG